MKKVLKKIIDNKILLSFLLSFLLGSIIVVPEIIAGGGIYNIADDFNLQQIPFNEFINSSIKSGNIFWNNASDLGSNLIGTFSFYNMFSIFNIISYLFPAKWFVYLVGPIFILKYAVAGLTSYLFLKRYVKNKNYAIIGSLLYAFSGFQLTNILFYHFHDVVALFPLLLYTFDNLIYDNRKNKFSITVALLLFTNWFFFIGEVVFLVIYYFVKIFTKDIKFELKKLFQIIFEGIIGVGITSIVILPSLLFTMGNPRINGSWEIINMFKYYNYSMYFEIIRGFILSPEAMNNRAIISETNYTSVELLLPFVGVVYYISYMFKDKKSWHNVLAFILLIMMFIPILNSTFFVFTTFYYARWFFMPTLIFSLLTIKAMEEKVSIKKGVIITLILYSLVVFYIYAFAIKYKESILFDKQCFIYETIMMLVSLLFVIVFSKIKNLKKFIICTVCAIFVCTSVWGNYIIYRYKSNNFGISKEYTEYYNSYKVLKLPDDYRVNGDFVCLYNFGYINNFSYIKSFNSNINPNNFKFYKSVGIDRVVSTLLTPESEKDLNDFLSVKYVINCDTNTNLEDYGYEFYKKQGSYNIYKNKDYLEYGFAPNSYISQKEFNKLSSNKKREIIKKYIVLSDKQIKKYSKLYNNSLNLVEYKNNDFKYIKNGFESNIETNKEILAIYTIPYDEGFTAIINGKKVKIENVDNGLMAVKLNKGKNKIEFKYVPKGLKEGIIISILSFIIFIMYGIILKKEKLNEKR